MGAGKHVRREFADGRCEKSFGAVGVRKERFHFPTQRFVAAAGRRDERHSVYRVSLEGSVTDVLNPQSV
jgi:hypothetical protein